MRSVTNEEDGKARVTWRSDTNTTQRSPAPACSYADVHTSSGNKPIGYDEGGGTPCVVLFSF